MGVTMSTTVAMIDPQNAAAGLIVLVAVGYLARRVWLSVRRQRLGGCGNCGTCPAEASESASGGSVETAHGRPLITLESLARTARREPREPSQSH